MESGTASKAKHIFLGVLFAVLSIVVVRALMAALYDMLSRPFDGVLAAGIAFNLVLGLLSVALYQTLFLLTTDRRLTITATRYAAGIGVFVQVSTVFRRIADGIVPGDLTAFVPTIAMVTPWIVAALIAHRWLVVDWIRRPQKYSADTDGN